MSIRPKNIDKNLFNKIFISHNNKNYSQRQKQFDGIKNYGKKSSWLHHYYSPAKPSIGSTKTTSDA